jgi:hypothetical protein
MYHDLSAKFSAVSDENFTLREKLEKLVARNNTSKILDDLIKPYAKNTFRFMCIYCFFAATILITKGFCPRFGLSNKVLQILVGSTAVTVIGLVGMVLTGVFVGARGKQ